MSPRVRALPAARTRTTVGRPFAVAASTGATRSATSGARPSAIVKGVRATEFQACPYEGPGRPEASISSVRIFPRVPFRGARRRR